MDIFDPRVQNFIDEKYIPLNDKLASFREVGEKDMIPIILKDTEMFLGSIIDIASPKRILEIGTAIGYSSAYFALKAKDSVVVTIEKDELAYRAAIENHKKLGVSDNIRVIFGDGQEQAEKLYDEGTKPFDLIFLDAAKSHYRRFLESVMPLTHKGSIIVSDNVFMRGMTVTDEADPKDKHRTNIRKMREYIDIIMKDGRMNSSVLPIGDGVALSVII